MKKFFEEFKKFAVRGNVMDMAIGVVFGAAFGKITTSIDNDIIMPLIAVLIGGLDFSAWKWVLKEAVVEAGEIVTPEVAVNFGNLISVILDFIIVAFAMFLVVKGMNKLNSLKKKEEEAKPEEPKGPTQEELLSQILDELKKQGK